MLKTTAMKLVKDTSKANIIVQAQRTQIKTLWFLTFAKQIATLCIFLRI